VPDGLTVGARYVLHVEGWSDNYGAYALDVDCSYSYSTEAPTATPAPSQRPTATPLPFACDFEPGGGGDVDDGWCGMAPGGVGDATDGGDADSGDDGAAEGCPSTCYTRTCDYWWNAGYGCDDLETTYGCDCAGCAACAPGGFAWSRASGATPTDATGPSYDVSCTGQCGQ
jgi:hypothetical protein